MYGTWIRIYYILCLKTYGTFGGLFWYAAGSRRVTRGARICETRLLVGSFPSHPEGDMFIKHGKEIPITVGLSPPISI